MYNVRQALGSPAPMQVAPMTGMLNVAPPIPQAFTWGAGGAMLTPDQLAKRQAMAQSLMKSDYSPIASPWQGLGRIADNLLGAMQQKKLDKQAAAGQEYSSRLATALMGGGGGDVAAAAMVDPYASPEVRGLAEKVYDRAHPKPVNNDTVNDFNFIGQQLGPQAGKQYLTNMIDPVVNVPLPDGRI
jgi:hypothetical protein